MEENNQDLVYIAKETDKLLQKMYARQISKEEYRKLQIYLLLFRDKTNYPVCTTSLTGDQIMFISDTHFGYGRENPRLVSLAYNRALKENIKTVIHLGDLINGALFHPGVTLDDLKKEMQMALQCLPDEIVTKLLLGNHDYYTMNWFPEMGPMYFTTPKLEILGLKSVIANWDNLVRLGLFHNIEKDVYIPNPLNNYVDLYMCGHLHEYSVDEKSRNIVVPTLGYGITDAFLIRNGYSITKEQDSFVIASKEDDSILFKLYDSKEQIKDETLYDIKTHTLKRI